MGRPSFSVRRNNTALDKNSALLSGSDTEPDRMQQSLVKITKSGQ